MSDKTQHLQHMLDICVAHEKKKGTDPETLATMALVQDCITALEECECAWQKSEAKI